LDPNKDFSGIFVTNLKLTKKGSNSGLKMATTQIIKLRFDLINRAFCQAE